MLLGEVPAAFHAGMQDILLIAFALAVAEFLGAGAAPIGIDVEGHGRDEELGRQRGPLPYGRLVHHQIPGVSERRGARRWTVAGRR